VGGAKRKGSMRTGPGTALTTSNGGGKGVRHREKMLNLTVMTRFNQVGGYRVWDPEKTKKPRDRGCLPDQVGSCGCLVTLQNPKYRSGKKTTALRGLQRKINKQKELERGRKNPQKPSGSAMGKKPIKNKEKCSPPLGLHPVGLRRKKRVAPGEGGELNRGGRLRGTRTA